MANENNSAFKFSSTDLIEFAWKKRNPLMIITFIAIVISTIISYRITELYKSTVVLYPIPAASVSKYLLTTAYAGKQTLFEFGAEEQCDQLIQILNSEKIKNRIINKYDLFTHYDIDPNEKHKNYEMNKVYQSNIRFRRTKYVSVEIEVLDKDPRTSANIANDIAGLIDSTMNGILHERTLQAVYAVKNEFYRSDTIIKVMEDSLRIFQLMGIINVEYQAKELTKAYATAIIDGKETAAKVIANKLKILEKYSGIFTSLSEKLILEYNRRMVLEQRYTEAKVDAEQLLPYKYVVDNAIPADKKSYPKKSLIILQFTIATFILAYIVLLFISLIRSRQKTA